MKSNVIIRSATREEKQRYQNAQPVKNELIEELQRKIDKIIKILKFNIEFLEDESESHKEILESTFTDYHRGKEEAIIDAYTNMAIWLKEDFKEFLN